MPQQTIKISGRKIVLKASGATPRLYAVKFENADIFQDIRKMSEECKTAIKENRNFKAEEMRILENLIYILIEPECDTPEELLSQFTEGDKYIFINPIINLWNENMKTTVDSGKTKKKITDRLRQLFTC